MYLQWRGLFWLEVRKEIIELPDKLLPMYTFLYLLHRGDNLSIRPSLGEGGGSAMKALASRVRFQNWAWYVGWFLSLLREVSLQFSFDQLNCSKFQFNLESDGHRFVNLTYILCCFFSTMANRIAIIRVTVHCLGQEVSDEAELNPISTNK